MQYTDDVPYNCTLKTYIILLTNVNPISLIFFKLQGKNKIWRTESVDQNKLENYQTIAVYGLHLDTNLKLYILYVLYTYTVSVCMYMCVCIHIHRNTFDSIDEF